MKCEVCGVEHKQQPLKPYYWSHLFGGYSFQDETKARNTAQKTANRNKKTVDVFFCDGSPHEVLMTTMHVPLRKPAFSVKPEKAKK